MHRGLSIDDGAIAGDDAGVLQSLDPAQAWRGRQADPLGQFDIAQPPVGVIYAVLVGTFFVG